MVDDFEKFFDEVYDRFRDSEGWVLFPKPCEVLTELKNRRVKLGVISNFDNRVYTVMDSLDIRAILRCVSLSSSETGYCKPDPEIFHRRPCDRSAIRPKILFVGDSLHDDVEAGIRAGLRAVLIDRTGPSSGCCSRRADFLIKGITTPILKDRP